MHMHMFFLACSQPNLTKPQKPRQRQERLAFCRVVMNTAAKGASHGEHPFFQCEGCHRYSKVDVETKERRRKIPFFLKCDSGGHHSTRGE